MLCQRSVSLKSFTRGLQVGVQHERDVRLIQIRMEQTLSKLCEVNDLFNEHSLLHLLTVECLTYSYVEMQLGFPGVSRFFRLQLKHNTQRSPKKYR